MTLEIFYRGQCIKEVEIPDGVNIDGLKFSARLQSKLNTDSYIEPEFIERPEKRHYTKPAKRLKVYTRDVPRVKIPEKETVQFQRPKAEYSNPTF